MTIASIENIKAKVEEIKNVKDDIRASDYAGSTYGQENEFQAKGLLAGLDAILKDISALTRAHVKFTKRSNHAERTSILSSLSNIFVHLSRKNLNQVALELDNLKPIIRNINFRHSNERLEEFDTQIDQLQRNATNIAEKLKELEKVKNNFESINESLEVSHSELENHRQKFEEEAGNLETLGISLVEKIEAANTLVSEAEEHSKSIETLLSESKEYSQLIESFGKKVAERENQLEDQSSLTEKYGKSLTDFKKQHDEILSESVNLIESAKQALEYKTAEGLSAAFSEQLNQAKNDKTTLAWAIGALVFLASAVGLGLWALSQNHSDGVSLLLARLSLVPILLLGAGFSASQYVKNKNIIEDYAYKSVLAKSLVGFSEQLSNSTNRGDLHAHFIKSVLAEIHNDPLMKSSKSRNEKASATEIINLIKNSIKAGKTSSQISQQDEL